MEPVLVALELLHQARRWVRRGAKERRLQSVQRVGAREHVRDVPRLRAGDRAAPEGRHQPGSHDGGLPAPARPDDREEPGLLHPLDELLDELLASEEVGRVAFLERAEAFVGVRGDRTGDGGVGRATDEPSARRKAMSSAASSASARSRITCTGSARPFSWTEPRST